MKLRACIWLQVSLCILTTHLAGAAIPGSTSGTVETAAADVSGVVRPPTSADRNLNTPSLMQTDLQILERARAANDDVYTALQSFVCSEQIERFRGTISADFGRQVDTISAKLSFERGVEQYSEILQNSRSRPSLSSLPGAWSEGEFGTLLLQTQQLLQTQTVAFDNFTDLAGVKAAIFRFDVPVQDSPWDLTVAGHHYKIPFRTNVWISAETGEILKIERVSSALAPDTRISEIQWGITLGHVDLNGRQWLLPRSGTYAVLYQESRRREWNVLNFSNYKRYSAETAVKFN